MPIALRGDFDAPSLRAAARKSKDAGQARRLLALAAVYDGATRTEAAKIGGVTLQIVRDWVVKFNAHGPDGLIDRKAPGQPSRLNDTHRAALAADHREWPDPGGARRGALADRRSVPVDLGGIPGCHRPADAEPRTARAGLPQAVRPAAPSRPGRRRHRGILKKLPRRPGRSRAPKGVDPAAIEIWFADEARDRPEEQDHPPLGQARHPAVGAARPAHRLDLHLRRDLPQARQGRRPRPAPLQHRRDEPASGRDRDRGRAGRARRAAARPGRLAHVRPARRAAQHHAHAAAGQMPRTQPGRERLAVHARQLALQPRLPLRRDIVDHCCDAWNKLVDQPWRIMSIGLRDWAHGF